MNLEEITLPELKQLLLAIPVEIKRREKTEKQRIRKELEALAAQSGYSLDELLNEASEETKKVRVVAAKYRHPGNSSLEWSGRGRQPRWVAEFIATGSTLDQLVIS